MQKVLIVLGCGPHQTTVLLEGDPQPSAELKGRLDAALQLCRDAPDALVVCSGGIGAAVRPYPESFVMKRYLESHSITQSIIEENRSLTTVENILLSRDILLGIPLVSCDVMLVTSDYHLPRALALANHLMPQWKINGTGASEGITEKRREKEQRMMEKFALPEQSLRLVLDGRRSRVAFEILGTNRAVCFFQGRTLDSTCMLAGDLKSALGSEKWVLRRQDGKLLDDGELLAPLAGARVIASPIVDTLPRKLWGRRFSAFPGVTVVCAVDPLTPPWTAVEACIQGSTLRDSYAALPWQSYHCTVADLFHSAGLGFDLTPDGGARWKQYLAESQPAIRGASAVLQRFHSVVPHLYATCVAVAVDRHGIRLELEWDPTTRLMIRQLRNNIFGCFGRKCDASDRFHMTFAYPISQMPVAQAEVANLRGIVRSVLTSASGNLKENYVSFATPRICSFESMEEFVPIVV